MASPRSSKKKPRNWRRIAAWTAGIIAAIGLTALIALVVAVYSARASLPSYEALKSSPNGQMIRVRAADGTVIVSLGPSYGEWIAHDDIPAVMRDAMVAVEDRRFESHWGVDPIALARIAKFAWDNYGTDRRLQGASTITQQVARTIFLSNKYDISRKFREMILALAMERKFSKEQILELYLKKVYLGGGAYGIDAPVRFEPAILDRNHRIAHHRRDFVVRDPLAIARPQRHDDGAVGSPHPDHLAIG